MGEVSETTMSRDSDLDTGGQSGWFGRGGYRRWIHATATAVAAGTIPIAAVNFLPATASEATQPPRSAKSAKVPREMGFIFSIFHYAIYPGMKSNCPGGHAYTNSEAYLASLPATERARLSKPENELEFSRLWKADVRGPNNTNLCTNFDQFPERPLQRTLQGKIAYGIDLDGGGRGVIGSCKHDEFVSPEGDQGIDNQAYRAMGCMRMWRADDGTEGDFIRYQQEWLSTGEYTNLLLLRGVDSLENDDDIEVIIASSLDHPIVDAQQHFVEGASYDMTSNPRWKNVLRGRIRHGVLTTHTKDIFLRQPIQSSENMPRMLRTETVFEQGRMRLTFQPDGSVKGVIGGYAPLLQLFERSAVTGVGATDTVNYDCGASYNTLGRLADGGRDPKTGQCTTISTAFEVAAIPAFVFERSAEHGRNLTGARR